MNPGVHRMPYLLRFAASAALIYMCHHVTRSSPCSTPHLPIPCSSAGKPTIKPHTLSHPPLPVPTPPPKENSRDPQISPLPALVRSDLRIPCSSPPFPLLHRFYAVQSPGLGFGDRCGTQARVSNQCATSNRPPLPSAVSFCSFFSFSWGITLVLI